MSNNKYLRLLVNGKMVFGEVGMYNGLCQSDKDYIIQLQVAKKISPYLKKEGIHICYNELQLGNIYELKLMYKDNILDLGSFLYDEIEKNDDDIDDQIILLKFEKL